MVHTAKIQELICKSIGFGRVLGKVKVLSANNGKISAETLVEKECTNPFGTLHGGYSATLVDAISSYALLTHPYFVKRLQEDYNMGVSIDIHISYLRAAKIGESVIVTANTVKAGRTLAFLDVLITNKETGDIIVKGSHTKFVGS